MLNQVIATSVATLSDAIVHAPPVSREYSPRFLQRLKFLVNELDEMRKEYEAIPTTRNEEQELAI